MFKMQNVDKKMEIKKFLFLSHNKKIKQLLSNKGSVSTINARLLHLYLLNDKYSIKPDKEIKIIRSAEGNFKKEIIYFNSLSLSFYNLYENSKRLTKRIFLPRDYPNSVKEGYSHYSLHSFYSGTCFHVMNFLSTQAIITSLNISVSQPLSYSFSIGMNWVLKEMFGQMGSIVFAAKWSRPIERELKQWRLISLWIYNFSIIADCLTLLYPQKFLLIASFSTLSNYF
jgi:hypothetical protein